MKCNLREVSIGDSGLMIPIPDTPWLGISYHHMNKYLVYHSLPGSKFMNIWLFIYIQLSVYAMYCSQLIICLTIYSHPTINLCHIFNAKADWWHGLRVKFPMGSGCIILNMKTHLLRSVIRKVASMHLGCAGYWSIL